MAGIPAKEVLYTFIGAVCNVVAFGSSNSLSKVLCALLLSEDLMLITLGFYQHYNIIYNKMIRICHVTNKSNDVIKIISRFALSMSLRFGDSAQYLTIMSIEIDPEVLPIRS